MEILEKIYNSTLKLLEPLTAEKTFEIIVKEAIKLVNGDDGLIFLNVDKEFVNVYASSEIGSQVQPRKRGYAYESLTKQKAFIIDSKDFASFHPHVVAHGIKTTVFIPLSYRKSAVGVLLVRSKKVGAFRNTDLNILKLFGAMASLAIRKVQLYEETHQALELRDLFIRMASHELRTPLTTVNVYTQLLYEDAKDKETEQAKWIKRLKQENARLTNLIMELLEVNRIRSGQLQFVLVECHINEILRTAVENFKLNHKDHSIELYTQVADGKDVVIGDFDKLLQVFNNVLDNAAKFSPPDSTITIKFQRNSSFFTIAVIDRGKGIPKENINKVFNAFYKDSELNSGWGLGLYLAKLIIDEHHGKIALQSKLDSGTTIMIQLPKSKL